MKKFFKFLGILVVLLVVFFLVMCLIGPKELKMERSMVIDAPREVVWNQVVMYKNWANWSPWKKMDTTIVVTLGGTDGTPGATYSWEGKKSGSGMMTNAGMEGNTMKYAMDFKKPFEAKADGWFSVVDTEGKQKVTWAYHQELGFFMAGMFKTMSMFGGGMEEMFDDGLKMMKDYAEAHKADAGIISPEKNFNVAEVDFAGGTYATIRKTIPNNDDKAMMKFFDESYQAIGKAANSRINGTPAAIYYNWDTVKHTADVAVAMPVSAGGDIAGTTLVTVKPAKAYKLVLNGGYESMMAAHGAINMKLAADKKEHVMVLEEYVKGPGDKVEPSQYITNIYYIIK